MASTSPKASNGRLSRLRTQAEDGLAFIGAGLLYRVSRLVRTANRTAVFFGRLRRRISEEERLLKHLGDPLIFRTLVRQFYFTFPQAWKLFSALYLMMGVLFGILFVVAATREASGIFSTIHKSPGAIFGFVALNLAFPLLTIFLIAGRSGTAISIEVGLMKISGQVDGLRSVPVDLWRFIYLPRLAGLSIGVLAAIIYCNALSYVVCALTFHLMGFRLGDQFQQNFYTDLITSFGGVDILFLILKGLGAGVAIALVNTLAGMRVRFSPLEIPQAAANGAVFSLFAVLVPYAVLTVLQFMFK